jgi:hypothetical protein
VNQHAAIVDAWLERSATDLSPELRLRLFDAALSALWNRVVSTLGEVTLTAVAERMLNDAAEAFPIFAHLTVEPGHGFQCRELRDRVSTVPGAELNDAFRFVIVEFLTVLGRLTAEILSPELHTELSHVALPQSVVQSTPGAAPASPRRRKERRR